MSEPIVTKPAGYRGVELSPGLLRASVSERKSLTEKLEEIDPTERYAANEPEAKLDAFERQMKRFGIRWQSDLKSGRPASFVDEFLTPRQDEGAASRKPEGDARFFASNQPASWILYPEFINRQMRILPLPEDVLDELVAMVTPIDTNFYKTIYLNDNVQTAPGQAQRQLVRVGEGAEIPPMTIGTSENGVQLNKYGLSLRGSYETYRRLRVDLFSLMLSRISQQIKLDLATWGLNIAVNGDGNGNAATNYNVSTFDSLAPAGDGTVTDLVTSVTSTITKGLSYKAWVKFRASLYPLHVTTVVGRFNELLQVLMLQMPNIDPMALLALIQRNQGNQSGDKGAANLNMAVSILESPIRLIYHPWAPGGMLIGLDKRFGLEQLVENGAALTETDKDIKTQMNEIVISQVVGFGKFLPNSVATLTFA